MNRNKKRRWLRAVDRCLKQTCYGYANECELCKQSVREFTYEFKMLQIAHPDLTHLCEQACNYCIVLDYLEALKISQRIVVGQFLKCCAPCVHVLYNLHQVSPNQVYVFCNREYREGLRRLKEWINSVKCTKD